MEPRLQLLTVNRGMLWHSFDKELNKEVAIKVIDLEEA